MTLLLFFFFLSIIFSFLCSVWEAVLLSIPPAHVEIKRQDAGWVGERLKAFKDEVDRPLSAILTLNTIAHTVGAIGVGVQAAKIWGDASFEIGSGFTMNVAGFLVPTLMTLAILILSEIIPKTLGATYWKQLTNFTVVSLHIIQIILYPLVWLSQLITKALKKNKGESVFDRADFSAMADIGTREGIFEKRESKIIKNLLRLNTIQAKDIMTPRPVVIVAQEDMRIQDFYRTHSNLRFSRIPIYSKNKDQINGFILKDEMQANIINGQGEKKLGEIKREIMIVQEPMPLPDLFTRLMEKREHIAMVADEYGGFSGIVTMEDVIETLLGMEIMDEMDNIEDMQKLARKNWEERARKLGLLPEEDQKTDG